jgi:hypothetical protein
VEQSFPATGGVCGDLAGVAALGGRTSRSTSASVRSVARTALGVASPGGLSGSGRLAV